MAKGCSSAQFWDSLLNTCMPCHLICHKQDIISRCKKFCVISQCNERVQHYYDGLLKTCARCPEKCTDQNDGCPRNCLKRTTTAAARRMTLPPAGANAHSTLDPNIVLYPKRTTTAAARRIITKPVQTLPPTGVTTHNTVDPGTLVPDILLYSFWALCSVLVLTSLAVALRVILKETKSRSAKTGDKRAQVALNMDMVLPQEETQLRCDPSDCSIPTENCVCVHCFPDLKSMDQDCPIIVARSNQETAPEVQHAGDEWAGRDIYTSGSNLLHVGAVGWSDCIYSIHNDGCQ
ncbi:hypothetical protein NL108_007793 [Boleophthalmus pectinirostris]|nr:tumor necrosis factor receptor superfamily member 13B isoform X2 [Boleophthalmus pectinirostris]XP_055006038.1 tumor necrosis factor receptor superfamily member 13B isoform X2 [Boleophthalmus pectinirostris]XP_055006039.1 tumor necrosis factor receptor superfamily member 13B isoform X2 [Boleophthalmus pectinirostris]KAJ0060289.1 hypothetical protein NL108_007793 [Boleophthalmus pectinirostris]